MVRRRWRNWRQRRPASPAVLRRRRNRGFSVGVNTGLDHARGRHALVLNPDTELALDALALLVAHLDAHPEVAIAAPRLLNADGSDQRTARYFHTESAFLFGRRTVLSRLFPRNRLTTRYFVPASDAPYRVDWVSGACLAVRGEVYRTPLGHMDPGFFMYFEDEDLLPAGVGRRLPHRGQRRRAGVARGGGSPRRSRRSLVIEFSRGVFRYYSRHHARSWLDPRRSLALVALSLRSALLLGRSLLP
ncbi:MAG: glycosyltransferase [Dehalococcoidia bacterium]